MTITAAPAVVTRLFTAAPGAEVKIGQTADGKPLTATDRKIVAADFKGGIGLAGKIAKGVGIGLGAIATVAKVAGLATGPAMPFVEGAATIAGVAAGILTYAADWL